MSGVWSKSVVASQSGLISDFNSVIFREQRVRLNLIVQLFVWNALMRAVTGILVLVLPHSQAVRIRMRVRLGSGEERNVKV